MEKITELEIEGEGLSIKVDAEHTGEEIRILVASPDETFDIVRVNRRLEIVSMDPLPKLCHYDKIRFSDVSNETKLIGYKNRRWYNLSVKNEKISEHGIVEKLVDDCPYIEGLEIQAVVDTSDYWWVAGIRTRCGEQECDEQVVIKMDHTGILVEYSLHHPDPDGLIEITDIEVDGDFVYLVGYRQTRENSPKFLYFGMILDNL